MKRTGDEIHFGSLVDEKNGFQVIDCEACGFKHVYPLPDHEDLRAIYSEDYYSKEKPLYIEQYIEDVEWWRLTYAARLALIEKYVSPDGHRLLDIGSGPGYFLESATARGWGAHGIEPSTQAFRFASDLGVSVEQGMFDSESAHRFSGTDVVHLCNVLEHLPDPIKTVSLIHEILSDDGLVMVIVPNDYNPIQNALREHQGFSPWWVAPPHHLNYFSFSSLEQLLVSRGFRILERSCSFPIDLFLMMGDNYVGNDVVGRSVHQKRKRLEIELARGGLEDMQSEIYRHFADLGIGREIIVIAQKREV